MRPVEEHKIMKLEAFTSKSLVHVQFDFIGSDSVGLHTI